MGEAYLFAPIMEYSANIRFSMFLYYLKTNNFYKKLKVVCFQTVFTIFPDADEFITISNEFLSKTNSNYPKNLENMGNRNNSDFHKLAMEYILSTKNENDEILIWDEYKVTNKDGESVFTDYMNFENYMIDGSSLGASYIRDYNYIKKWLSDGNTLKPTYESYNKIKKTYGDLFLNKNTITIVTRNFLNKQPCDNTDVIVPNLKKLIEHLVQNDITVINVGFPPCNLLQESDRYFEISDNLTQDELMSLFYLSKITILNAYNAGYQTHSLANIDVLIMLNEFLGWFMYPGRNKNKNLFSEIITDKIESENFEYISNLIKNHEKKTQLLFSENKPVYNLNF